jgi:phenylacetate-CoA ligase
LNHFKSVLKFKGFPINKAEKEYIDIEGHFNKYGLDYTKKMAWNIFDYHRTNNPFYKEIIQSCGIKNWEDIPLMTKQNLQIPLKNRLSNSFTKNQIFINKTSGSSGHPFVFAKDKYAHAMTWAHIIKLYEQHGIKVGESLEARFYGIPKEFKGYYQERIKDTMVKRYRFNVLDLSDGNLSKFVKIFEKKPFEYINGYTSAIVMFAKHLQSEGLILKQVCPSLKICITTSEMLFNSDRELLEKVLGVPVINEYGASELGIIAFENTNNDWLINNQTLYTEVVDKNGKPLLNDEEGDIVVTSLHNKAHPFIRYKIGDIGSIKILNKQQILSKLVGRTNVFALLPSGKKVPALAFYYVTKSIIEDKGSIKELKVIQKTISKFLIKYVAETDLSPEQVSSITDAIKDYLEPGLKLAFERCAFLQRTDRGKLRQFETRL